MAKRIHTIVFVDGRTEERQSTTKSYTHVVIGKHSRTRAEEVSVKTRTRDGQNYDYHKHKLAQEIGAKYVGQDGVTYSWLVKDQDHDAARDFLRDYTSKEALVEGRHNARMAAIAERAAEGYYDRDHALAWSSRRDLGLKACAQFELSYTDVRVVEVTSVREVTPRAKKDA